MKEKINIGPKINALSKSLKPKVESCGCEHHHDSECIDHEHEKHQPTLTNSIHIEWMVSQLDCANCASKVERAIKALPYVIDANLRFDLGKLSVDVTSDKYLMDIEHCAKSVESDIVLKLVGQKKHNKEFNVSNVDCANCALKIENALNKLSGIKAIYRFELNKLTISSDDEIDDSAIINCVKSIENDAQIELSSKATSNAEEHQSGGLNKYLLIGCVLLFILLEIKIFPVNEILEIVVLGVIYILIGGKVLLKAFKNILRGDIFDENFLMAIATIGAIIIRSYDEAVAVMLFYQVGEYFQSLAVNNSRKSIQALMKIRPDVASVVVDDAIITRKCEDIAIDDVIIVYPGNLIPLDGIVIEGESSIDFSALSGESLPKNVYINDEVMSGGVNLNKIIKIRVTTLFENSTASKILTLVEEAGNKKAPTEKFITRFSKVYTPIVCLLALLLAIIPSLMFGDPATWIYRGLAFLVTSCPCALVISIPLSYFGGIGAASKWGILVKGSQYLEEILKVDTIASDKTGTLTKGSFAVSEIVSDELSREELLLLAAKLEHASTHPIGKAIMNANQISFDQNEIKNLEEVAGYGIKAEINTQIYFAGNERFMKLNNIDYPILDVLGSIVYIASDKYIGYISVSDTLKENSITSITNIQNKYHKTIMMFSGDNQKVVDVIAQQLGIKKAYGELLPQDKLNLIEQLQMEKHKVAFVGDGLNDAPVLSIANVGIAMGGIGSDAAIEASDIVLMEDDFSRIETLFDIASFTDHIVKQNLIFVFGIKVLVLFVVAIGYASMWTAVFADVGVSVIAILNSMRILKKKYS